MNKTDRFIRITGISLLLVMAGFHGSGLFYVKGLMDQSDASGFLKDILPVLFVHPSIHLLGLAALGILTFFLKQETHKVLYFIALLVLADVLLALYAGGWVPAGLLGLAAFLFALAGWQNHLRV